MFTLPESCILQESRDVFSSGNGLMAKLTAAQKARAKAMSKRKGVKYPNAWSNLTVARGKKKSKGKKA